jgi:hypothetical protein
VDAENAANPRPSPATPALRLLSLRLRKGTPNDSLQVLVQAKADFDKAMTNDGAAPSLAVTWNARTDSMQVLVRVFANGTARAFCIKIQTRTLPLIPAS